MVFTHQSYAKKTAARSAAGPGEGASHRQSCTATQVTHLPARQVLHYVNSGGRSQDSKTPGLAVRTQAAAEKSEH